MNCGERFVLSVSMSVRIQKGGEELALLTEGTKIRPQLSMVGCKFGRTQI